MVEEARPRGSRVTRETWIAQLLYVGLALIFLWELLQDLSIGSVSATDTHLFIAGFILLMVITDVVWRLAFARRRYVLVATTIFIAALTGAGSAQALLTMSAHDSLAAYSRFRGCTELLSRTTTKATCRLGSGQAITMVEQDSRWFLEGDGPGQW